MCLWGGYTQDLSEAPNLTPDNVPKPKVTASQVKDRKTLTDFTQEAARIAKEQILGGTSVPQLRNVFRDDKGDWKSGSVYVWIVSDQNINLFHGANLSLEHRFANFDRVDKNGKRFVEELVKGARENEGGQFLQYFYDNPNNPNDGDEEAKLGYAYSFELYEGQGKFVIGSGIYTGDLDD